MPRGCGHATPHAQAPAQPGSPMIAARKPQHLPRLRQSPCSVRPFQPCHEQCLQPSLPNLQGDAIRGERGHPSENAKRVTTYAPNRPADERPTSFGAPFAFLLSRRVGRISEPNRPSQRLRQIQSSFPLRWVDEVSRTSSAHFFFLRLRHPASHTTHAAIRLRFSPQGPSDLARTREAFTGILRKARRLR
jgi:hypothetical protein